MDIPRRYRGRLRPLVGLGLFMVMAFALGQVWQAPAQMRSPFENPPPRQHFLSGSERSEQVLRDIADTLKQIDSRLERLEQTAQDVTQALQKLRDRP